MAVLARTVPTNLTPGATKLWQHYLDTFQPPSAETIARHRALNALSAMIEDMHVPRLTMHQEMMVAAMVEYEQTPAGQKGTGKRYRLRLKLARNGINVHDYAEKPAK